MLKLVLLIVAGLASAYVIVLIRGFLKAMKRQPAERFPADFATPYGALRVYQSARDRGDVDAMVAAKDFRDEAEVMLRKSGSAMDEDVVEQTAVTLEAAFRAQWKDAGETEAGGQSFFSEALPLAANVVFVHHTLVYPSGAKEDAQVRLVRRGAYWRVSHAPI